MFLSSAGQACPDLADLFCPPCLVGAAQPSAPPPLDNECNLAKQQLCNSLTDLQNISVPVSVVEGSPEDPTSFRWGSSPPWRQDPQDHPVHPATHTLAFHPRASAASRDRPDHSSSNFELTRVRGDLTQPLRLPKPFIHHHSGNGCAGSGGECGWRTSGPGRAACEVVTKFPEHDPG